MALPRIEVDVEMMDGTIHENIRVILADMIRHSDVARRHKWGGLEDDPVRAQAFYAYAAMTRLGLYDPAKGFDEFTNDVSMVMADMGDELDPSQ